MHFESLALEDGSIGKLRCPPGTGLSLPTDLATPSRQGVYVLCVLGGHIRVTHADGKIAKNESILIFDAAHAIGVEAIGRRPVELMTLQIPSARLCGLNRPGAPSAGQPGVQEVFRSPLTGCMRLIAEHLHTATKEALSILYEACVSLLVASQIEMQVERRLANPAASNHLLHLILDYTHRNIADRGLSPGEVARRFGISVRYLHKLFTAVEVTFGTYVANRRLEHVHRDLSGGRFRQQSISQVAEQWGFGDISAFNKAFRKRFGCSPRSLRVQSDRSEWSGRRDSNSRPPAPKAGALPG
jgi:AraC family transcriptional regulator, positive regulator of tynA and feaB